MVDGIKPTVPARMPEISPKPAKDAGAIEAINPVQPTAQTGGKPKDPKEILDLFTARDNIARATINIDLAPDDTGKPKPQNSR